MRSAVHKMTGLPCTSWSNFRGKRVDESRVGTIMTGDFDIAESIIMKVLE